MSCKIVVCRNYPTSFLNKGHPSGQRVARCITGLHHKGDNMRIPQSITINLEPIDDGNLCHIDFSVLYPCNDAELKEYIAYALEAVKAEGGKGEE